MTTLYWQASLKHITNLQHGIITIPKSTKEQRIKENASVFDFELTQDDMNRIDALNENLRVSPDRDNFDF